jgi:hypothetical protein
VLGARVKSNFSWFIGDELYNKCALRVNKKYIKNKKKQESLQY